MTYFEALIRTTRYVRHTTSNCLPCTNLTYYSTPDFDDTAVTCESKRPLKITFD